MNIDDSIVRCFLDAVMKMEFVYGQIFRKNIKAVDELIISSIS